MMGSRSRILPEIGANGTFSIKSQLLFSAKGMVKVMAHVETIHPAKVIVKKSKYEAPDIVLDDIEGVQWYKPGLSLLVVE